VVLWQKHEKKWTDNSIWKMNSPSIKAKEYLNTLIEFGVFHTYPPYYTERNGLDMYLLVYTIEGTGYLQYEDKQYTLKKGNIFFIHCDTYQKYWSSENDRWDFIWVHTNGKMVESYYHLLQEQEGYVLKIQSPHFIERMLYSLIPLLNQQSFYYEIAISQTIQHILAELLKQTFLEPSNIPNMPEYIRELQKILSTEYEQKLTLDMLSKRVAVNKFQMSKQFKQYVGFSPNEFLILQRMNAAKHRLRMDLDSVTDISKSVGIEDISHFIGLFKKREGITPLAYRQIWSESLER